MPALELDISKIFYYNKYNRLRNRLNGDKMKNATMQDVANLANVDKSTVSHVINKTRFVAEETRQRVIRAIEDLNYRPSLIARSLSLQQSFTVALLISDVSNPFYNQIIRGIEDVATENEYSVYLLNANYDHERSIRYIRSMAERRVDGVILMSSRMSNELIDEALQNNLSTVVVDWDGLPKKNLSILKFDFKQGIQDVISHLYGLDHRRFAHVSGNLELWTASIRRDLFLSVLSEYGISPEDVPVLEGNFSIESGRNAFHTLIKRNPRPTAIFTVNDMTAIGLLLEAQKYGLNIPNELSVVGVDNISLGADMTPPLSTLSLKRYQTGKKAMGLLLDSIAKKEGGGDPGVVSLIIPELKFAWFDISA